MRMASLVLFGVVAVASLGCRPEQEVTTGPTGGAASTPEQAAPAAAPAAPAVSPAGVLSKVTRIVFVDKENACACTRERADTSWAELQAALGEDSKLPVERIYLDTQPDKAEPYLKLAQLMVVPGVYLLAEGDKLVEVLQGEVTQDQLRIRLGTGAGAQQ